MKSRIIAVVCAVISSFLIYNYAATGDAASIGLAALNGYCAIFLAVSNDD